ICSISGSGNVALYAVEKAIELGAKVVTLSDSDGFVHVPNGINLEMLAFVKELKTVRRGRIHEFANHYEGVDFYAGKRPWNVPCDIAFPCATQNEINRADSQELINNGVKAVVEGANMPTNLDGIHEFRHAKVILAPAKAANAGGVAVSGLEQSQNALRLSWSREEVDQRLKSIMLEIHSKCVQHSHKYEDYTDYITGANIAGFTKVADAMLAYGIV
ncbi:MAG: glutamate dehydrogenase, partial [Cyanobacteriota bacterium]|nr:glutamate dehydrogenase [Cyanobacteriota bacterium]